MVGILILILLVVGIVLGVTTITVPTVAINNTAVLTNTTGQKGVALTTTTKYGVGTGTGNVGVVAQGEDSVTSGSNITLDFTNLLVAPNESYSLSNWGLIHIVNTSTTGNLTVGGGSNDVIGACPPLPPGGVLVLHDPKVSMTVSSTVKLLQFSADSGTITFSYEIMGRTS